MPGILIIMYSYTYLNIRVEGGVEAKAFGRFLFWWIWWWWWWCLLLEARRMMMSWRNKSRIQKKEWEQLRTHCVAQHACHADRSGSRCPQTKRWVARLNLLRRMKKGTAPTKDFNLMTLVFNSFLSVHTSQIITIARATSFLTVDSSTVRSYSRNVVSAWIATLSKT